MMALARWTGCDTCRDVPDAELESMVLELMVTFEEPDKRTAPPPRPAVESLNTEFCMNK